MWLDVIVALIFILSTAQGLRNGFVHTFIHAVGWILSVVLGYAWYPKVADFLRGKTDLYDSLHFKIIEKIGGESASHTAPITDGLPVVLKDAAASIEQTVTGAIADSLSGFLFNIICFLFVVIVVRLILLLLSSLLSKKNNDGVTGFVDGFFGLIAGVLKGILLIFLFLALLVPIIGLSGGDTLSDALAASVIAGMLYDNNLIFVIIKDFI